MKPAARPVQLPKINQIVTKFKTMSSNKNVPEHPSKHFSPGKHYLSLSFNQLREKKSHKTTSNESMIIQIPCSLFFR